MESTESNHWLHTLLWPGHALTTPYSTISHCRGDILSWGGRCLSSRFCCCSFVQEVKENRKDWRTNMCTSFEPGGNTFVYTLFKHLTDKITTLFSVLWKHYLYKVWLNVDTETLQAVFLQVKCGFKNWYNYCNEGLKQCKTEHKQIFLFTQKPTKQPSTS